MGQKVHPLGFRLNTTQKHKSIWFAQLNQYSALLEQDEIKKIAENTSYIELLKKIISGIHLLKADCASIVK